jgi:ABC-2 type transport system permease protein
MAILIQLTRHELRLAWRDWVGMLTAGKPKRTRWAFAGVVTMGVLMHLLASAMIGSIPSFGSADKRTLIALGASAMLTWFLMLSQALESVTRAFYARGDLALLLSSPVSARTIFTVRIVAVAVSVSGMALLLAAPFINVLAASGGLEWLSAYGVVLAMGMIATAVAVALTVALFSTVGPKRTRLLSQIASAVIGAAFVIGIQVAAILSYGSLARANLLQSEAVMAWAPEAESVLWWPMRAATGEGLPLAAAVTVGTLLLGATIAVFGQSFGTYAVAAAGVDHTPSKGRSARPAFQRRSARAVLRRKEWILLTRDPWLTSQTLMQLLYLIPPALLLWRSYGQGDTLLVLVPVLVMAAGQLAGGLAWLAVSGEDAPDLVATAPVASVRVLAAKVEAVMGAVGLVFAPLIFVLAVAAPSLAGVAAIGIVVAAGCATLIQLWFRAQAKRKHFRSRQTSSRLATFAEAFSSIGWASTFALAALNLWLGLIASILPLIVLAIAWLGKPETHRA